MKNFLTVALLLFANPAFTAQAPFSPAVDDRFIALEAGSGLSTGAVTAAKIGTGAVTSAKILDGDIAAVDIAAGAVSETKLPVPTADGLNAHRVARATFDVGVGANTGIIGTTSLGVTLPAKSIITKIYYYIVTQFADAGSGTVALHCEDANNILTATDITGSAAGVIGEGATTGLASNMVKNIGAACAVTATIAGADQSAGKLIAFIEYVVGL